MLVQSDREKKGIHKGTVGWGVVVSHLHGTAVVRRRYLVQWGGLPTWSSVGGAPVLYMAQWLMAHLLHSPGCVDPRN